MIDAIQRNTERLVSIIVPVYNCEKYIEKCLNSIICQSYRQIEVLVVNDGSTDGSQKIIDNMAQSDLRIRKLIQKNQGVSAARNYALNYAKGDYYLFVDADDYIGKDHVKDLVECANENQSELVICGYTIVYTNKKKRVTVIPGLYKKMEKEEWAYRISSAWGRLYSSEFWNKNSLHFVTEEGAGGEDAPITLFANYMAKNIQTVCKSDYFYVQREGSAMNSKKKVMFLFPYAAFEEIYSQVRNLKATNSRMFFDMGVIKLLAMFKYVIYRKADRNEKKKFNEYTRTLLDTDFIRMKSEWIKLKKNIELPLTHKMAVSIFLWQMAFERNKYASMSLRLKD